MEDWVLKLWKIILEQVDVFCLHLSSAVFSRWLLQKSSRQNYRWKL